LKVEILASGVVGIALGLPTHLDAVGIFTTALSE
jgi:hypothetical protein